MESSTLTQQPQPRYQRTGKKRTRVTLFSSNYHLQHRLTRKELFILKESSWDLVRECEALSWEALRATIVGQTTQTSNYFCLFIDIGSWDGCKERKFYWWERTQGTCFLAGLFESLQAMNLGAGGGITLSLTRHNAAHDIRDINNCGNLALNR